MLAYENKLNHCCICKHEYTSKHILTPKGEKIFVCGRCQEATKYNFIWLCFNCGKVYISPKYLILNSVKDPDTLTKFENMMAIQKVEICTECNNEEIFNYNNYRKHRHGIHKKVSLTIPEDTGPAVFTGKD
jgi:hypothetical protein